MSDGGDKDKEFYHKQHLYLRHDAQHIDPRSAEALPASPFLKGEGNRLRWWDKKEKHIKLFLIVVFKSPPALRATSPCFKVRQMIDVRR